MNFFRTIVDALRGTNTNTSVNTSRPTAGPAIAQICERVDPDGSLVSQRAPVRVYALTSDQTQLPDETILYIPPGAPDMQFRFTIVRCVSGEYRAYIRQRPSYGSRATDAITTHRLHDARGDYICWRPMPRSARGILQVSRLWADRTARYISTGRRIEQP